MAVPHLFARIVAAATGLMQMPPISLLEVAIPLTSISKPVVTGVQLRQAGSIRMLMANQARVEVATRVVPVTGNGGMASMSPALPILELSGNSLASRTTPRNSKRESTSKSTTIYPSRHLDKVFPSQSPRSRILHWTTISSPTLSLLDTRFRLRSRSTLSPLSWVVET